MLADWIYGHPLWLTGTLIVGCSVLVSCAGLAVVGRFVPVAVRREHNDVVGPTIAIVGVVVAVLLAFVAVSVWETFSKDSALVQDEADYLGNLHLDTAGLPRDLAQKTRAALLAYAGIVIDEEWPALRAGKMPPISLDKGWTILRAVHAELAHYQPETSGQAVILGEMIRTLDDLYNARRGRLLAGAGHIPAVVWWIMILSSAVTVGYTYLFGARSVAMHLVMSGSIAGSLALILVLIVAFANPFRGELGISSAPFERVKQRMEIAGRVDRGCLLCAHRGSPA
jgi:hypothetical protein